jgi:hypothetical protein
MYEENKINYNHIFEAAIAETKTVDRSFARGFAISIDRSARPKLKTKSPCRRAITQEELLEQYSFGSIAAKNFDDTEYGN